MINETPAILEQVYYRSLIPAPLRRANLLNLKQPNGGSDTWVGSKRLPGVEDAHFSDGPMGQACMWRACARVFFRKWRDGGCNTGRAFITSWAPAYENDLVKYFEVVTGCGVDVDAPMDLFVASGHFAGSNREERQVSKDKLITLWGAMVHAETMAGWHPAYIDMRNGIEYYEFDVQREFWGKP